MREHPGLGAQPDLLAMMLVMAERLLQLPVPMPLQCWFVSVDLPLELLIGLLGGLPWQLCALHAVLALYPLLVLSSYALLAIHRHVPAFVLELAHV